MYKRQILFDDYWAKKLNEKVDSSKVGMGGDCKIADKPNAVKAKGIQRFGQYPPAKLRKIYGISESHVNETINKYDFRNDYYYYLDINLMVQELLNANPEELHLSE